MLDKVHIQANSWKTFYETVGSYFGLIVVFGFGQNCLVKMGEIISKEQIIYNLRLLLESCGNDYFMRLLKCELESCSSPKVSSVFIL